MSESKQVHLDLSDDVKAYVTMVKEQEKVLLALIEGAPEGVSQRWRAIARTHIQEGRMALVRAVTEKD